MQAECEPVPLGFLQCARVTCGFCVTSVTETYCCYACEGSSGEHDHECLQLSINDLSVEIRHGSNQWFSLQLCKLLGKKGPQHLSSLPHVWDTEYGNGSWVNSRPVKAANKACSYSSRTEVVDQVVYLLEESCDLMLDEWKSFVSCFRNLSMEVVRVLSDEFELVGQDFQVSTAVGTGTVRPGQRSRSFWRCRVTLREVDTEEQRDLRSCFGYGDIADSALYMAKLHILEKMARWDSGDLLPRLLELEKKLKDRVSGLVYFNTGEKDLLGTVREFTTSIGELLSKDGSKNCIVWRLLVRSWPYIVFFVSEDHLLELKQSMCSASSACNLNGWLRMAEVAACQVNPAFLGIMEEVRIEDQDRPTVAYCRHQLFNLLLEVGEQVKQEADRCIHGFQSVSLSWNLGDAGVTCTLREALNDKVDAILLNHDDVTFLCNAVGGSRFVVRAIEHGSVQSLIHAFGSRNMRCLPMSTYASITARQRETLNDLASNKTGSSFCPILKDTIIESWAYARSSNETGLQSCAKVLSESVGASGKVPEDLMSRLSPTQQQSVHDAASRRCSLVRGPPGTGKTHVAAAVAFVASRNLLENERILCVTQSHTAATNLQKRLELSFGVDVARVGTTLLPAEVVEQAVFKNVEQYYRGNDIEFSLFWEIGSQRREVPFKCSKELQKIQFDVMRYMVRLSNVVVVTLASSGNVGLLGGKSFFWPVLVIDEAAQVVEPAHWVALNRGCERMILVGDEKQLPATVLSEPALQRGLGVSLFERLVQSGLVSEGKGLVQLDQQRRMHPSISCFPSHIFYGGKLTNGPDTLELSLIKGFPWPNPWIHVAFVECGVDIEEGSRSYVNSREAEPLMAVLECCLRQGLEPKQVGVITGYKAQQELLQQHWAALAETLDLTVTGLRVDTVDGFQGGERDWILASTVRCSCRMGFMRDPRRANVMPTRARRGMIVFGNGQTLQTDIGVWKSWMEWVKENQIGIQADDLMEQLSSQAVANISPSGCASVAPADPVMTREVKMGPVLAAEESNVWREYFDPGSGQLWLWNEVTREAKWKEKL